MASFDLAYDNWVEPAEGFYGIIPGDSGGETYMGIARNYTPDWIGWKTIDNYKKQTTGGKPLKNNTEVPGMRPLVRSWYNDFWNKNNFGKIINQDVANILFDWFVNSASLAVYTPGSNTYGIDEILNRDYNAKLPTDKKVDMATVNAINSVKDQNALHDTIKAERIKFYNSLKLGHDNPQVLKGWLSRINKFPNLSTAIKIGGAIVLILLIVAVALLATN